MYALTRARTSSLVRSGVRYGHVRAARARAALLLPPPPRPAPASAMLIPPPPPCALQNHPIFEHHENWGQNKWKPALFVSTFVGIGLFVPWFGISFAQCARAAPTPAPRMALAEVRARAPAGASRTAPRRCLRRRACARAGGSRASKRGRRTYVGSAALRARSRRRAAPCPPAPRRLGGSARRAAAAPAARVSPRGGRARRAAVPDAAACGPRWAKGRDAASAARGQGATRGLPAR